MRKGDPTIERCVAGTNGRRTRMLLLALSLMCGTTLFILVFLPAYRQRTFEQLLVRAREQHDVAAAMALWNSLNPRATSAENGAAILIALVEPQIRIASPCAEGESVKLLLEPAFSMKDWSGCFFAPRGDVLSVCIDGFPVGDTNLAGNNEREIGHSTTLTLPPLSAGEHDLVLRYNVWVNMSHKGLKWPNARQGSAGFLPAFEERYGGFKGISEKRTTIQIGPAPLTQQDEPPRPAD